MHRRTRHSKQTKNNIDDSSSDSVSTSDSDDDSLEHQTASEVINSFLRPSRSNQHVTTPKSRKASDVINSFLQKNKIVEQASRSQFNSALDVINSYLRKDNFEENRTSAGRKECGGSIASESVSRTRQITESSTSDSDSDSNRNRNVAKKRRITESSTSDSDSDSNRNRNVAKKRRITESSTSDSDSDSVTNGNVAKKRRVENSRTAGQIDEIEKEPASCAAVSIQRRTSDSSSNSSSSTHSAVVNEGPVNNQVSGDGDAVPSDGNDSIVSTSPEVSRQSASVSTRRSLRSKSSKENGSARKPMSEAKSKQKAPVVLKMSFTRELFSRKMRTKRVVEQQTTIRDCHIPKDKYDRALAMLNATECRYDETPVDYNAPKQWYDFRHSCNSRRHAEATYDTNKLNTSKPISLTRIVFELDNCLRKENWSQMAELIYFGCDLMKTDQCRRAIGGAFFTYALLLLLLDPTPDSISTLDGKRNEILKFLIALGSDTEDSEAFLKDLHLVMDENDTANGLLTIKSEKE